MVSSKVDTIDAIYYEEDPIKVSIDKRKAKGPNIVEKISDGPATSQFFFTFGLVGKGL